MIRLLATGILLAAVTLAVFGATSLAAPGGNGKGKGNPSPGGNGRGNHATITLDQTDPHFGDQVTFTVSTSAEYPWVRVDCHQEGEWVYGQYHGYFEDYTFEQAFKLGPTPLWQGGGADCVARLYKELNGRELAVTQFGVLP